MKTKKYIKKPVFFLAVFLVCVIVFAFFNGISYALTTISSNISTTGSITVGSGGVIFSNGYTQTTAPKTYQLTKNFTAGENITAGDIVSLLNGQAVKGFDYDFGETYLFREASGSDWFASAVLSSTKFVIAYQDGYQGDGVAVIGDIANGDITFGQKYMFNSMNTDHISVKALSATKIAIAYRDINNSNSGTAIIGDVSGNVISFGSEQVFNSGLTYYMSIAILGQTKFAIAYDDAAASPYKGRAIIGDVSGTVISFGSEYLFNDSTQPYYTSAAALSATKFAIAYRDTGNSDYGTAIIGDVTDNVISFGSEYVFNSGTTNYISAAMLTSSSFVVAYTQGTTTNGVAIIGDVSGNVISFGTNYTYNSGTNLWNSVTALSSTKIAVAYEDGNTGPGKTIVGDINSGVITFGSEYTFDSTSATYVSAIALSSAQLIVGYSKGKVYAGNVSGNVIGSQKGNNGMGVAKTSASSGQTVSVVLRGISDGHTGLTAGTVYYGHRNGALTTNVTTFRVGVAVSSTEILLSGNRDNPDILF